MKEIDFTKAIVHNSAKEWYRTPLGAVPGGTRVKLRLSVRDFTFERAFLVILRDNFKMEVEMHREDDSGETYYVEYDTSNEPSVLWYWFSIKLAEDNWIYYGAGSGSNSGVGKLFWSPPPAFQLTVFDREYSTPGWFKNATMYQIFPDRFKIGNPENTQAGMDYHKKMGRDVFLHENWESEPLYRPIEGRRFYQPCDYFGGDLKGIEDSLDYLQELGITVIYLNPIFDAASNHRYNTGSYLDVDRFLGTLEDYQHLVKKADQYGMKILLDGVFSHTGDDSVYFNRYGNYNSVGAYQSQDSPYFHWYKFMEYPNQYVSWWGFETLPEVNELNQDWIDFIIENKDSVFNTWLDMGTAGFRLDVADELPDETIEKMRAVLKHNGQDNVLLGEVWEDATTKKSYGTNRKYALGRGLDSVMNYPLTNATVDFLLGRVDAFTYKSFLVGQSQNYPKEMYYALMNLLSSHDVPRVRSVLGTTIDATGLDREQQAHFVMTDEQDKAGARLQRLAVALQFSLPGVPSVYYGDETGMNGLKDPFNRRPFHVWDTSMQNWHKQISSIRQQHTALKTGYVSFYALTADLVGVLRYCINGLDAFGNETSDEALLTVVNRSDQKQKIVVDLYAEAECMAQEHVAFFREMELTEAKSLLSSASFSINEGLLEMEIEPKNMELVEILWI